MDDLELAENELKSRRMNLVIVKNGVVLYQSAASGMRGLLQAIEEYNGELAGTAVADKIVGRAAAMLCVYSEVKSVFAITITEGALKLLTKNRVAHKFEKYVRKLMNSQGTDVCPFEKAIRDIDDPKEALKILRSIVI
jgi:hypothetical protein